AASIFGYAAESLEGRKLTEMLTEESAAKLCGVARELEIEGRNFAWVPRGFDGVCSDGLQFPAEASVSRFELGEKPRYSVILRSVELQLAAESRVQELEKETCYLQSEIAESKFGGEIVGTSPAAQAVATAVMQVAPTTASVLIEGETGTGKEL